MSIICNQSLHGDANTGNRAGCVLRTERRWFSSETRPQNPQRERENVCTAFYSHAIRPQPATSVSVVSINYSFRSALCFPPRVTPSWEGGEDPPLPRPPPAPFHTVIPSSSLIFTRHLASSSRPRYCSDFYSPTISPSTPLE